MSITIHVNNSPVEVHEDELLLTALRRHGIKIPTLCHMQGFTPSGACRLCVVEIEGKRDLITSCTYPVEEGMVVITNSMRVIKARKALVEMLLSNHPDDCLYCERNGNCELQWLAEEMNIKERKYFSRKNTHKRDHSSTSVYRDPAKCVLCNRCVRVCEEVQLVTAIEFISRGNKTTVNSAFNKGLNMSSCIKCGQCIMVCPTGALVDISHIEKVQAAIAGPKKFTVALVSATFVASVAEHLNLKPADNPAGLIYSALRKTGFDKVLNLGWASDMHIHLEAALLQEKSDKMTHLPLLSSCCPAWIKYAEEYEVGLIEKISTVKSPQQLMGRLIKEMKAQLGHPKPEEIYNVSFMPCVANKFESSREENTRKGLSEIDATLTVREFLKFLRSHGIDLGRQEPAEADYPFHNASSAAWQMAWAGGKAEAVAMELNYLINGKNAAPLKFSAPKNPGSKKEVKVKIGKKEYGFAWVSSMVEAQRYIDELRAENRTDIHYVEIMACSGGCTGGGGQPIHWNPGKAKLRKKSAQELEKETSLKTAGHNKHMEDFLKENYADTADKEMLHTHFSKRDVLK